MNAQEQLIETFYKSFQNKDYEAMQKCYHSEIVFSDPVFPELKGWMAGAMWQMLVDKGGDMKIEFSDIKADENTGTASWSAFYVYPETKRNILNRIKATFAFKDGKIIKHTDDYSLWGWTRQALGFKGFLLGWAPVTQKTIREKSDKGLSMYIRRKKLDPDGKK